MCEELKSDVPNCQELPACTSENLQPRDIMSEVKAVGFDVGISIATECEIKNGVACGQLSEELKTEGCNMEKEQQLYDEAVACIIIIDTVKKWVRKDSKSPAMLKAIQRYKGGEAIKQFRLFLEKEINNG